jgi:hypothetical protein
MNFPYKDDFQTSHGWDKMAEPFFKAGRIRAAILQLKNRGDWI